MQILNKENPLQVKFPHTTFISQILFFMSFWLFIGATMYGNTTLRLDHKAFYQLLTKITWWCVIFSIINILFLSNYTIKQLILLAVMTILIYISYKNSGYRWFFQSAVILFSARHIHWKQYVQLTTPYYGLLLLSIFIFHQAGLITGVNFERHGRIREDIGFTHPNLFGAYLMILAMLWACVRYNQLKIWDYGVITLAAAIAYFLPQSRTSTFILILLLLMLFIMKTWGNRLLKSSAVRIFFLAVYPACFLLSYVCSYAFSTDQRLLAKIDQLLSGRISLTHAFMESYPVTWTGQKIKLVSSSQSMLTGKPTAILDNSYIRLYLQSGIIVTAIVMVMLVCIVYYALKQNNQALLICITLFAIYGISEFRITLLPSNVFLTAFAFLFQQKSTSSEILINSDNSV